MPLPIYLVGVNPAVVSGGPLQETLVLTSDVSGGGGGSVTSVNGFTGVVVLQLPQTFTLVSNEFLTSYNAGTGLFTAAQPTYAGISGTPNLTVYALLTGAVFSGNVTLNAELIDGVGSHGTNGQVLSSTGTGVQWT